MPFLVVGIVGHGAMRASGEGRWPSIIMVGSAMLNVLLTPILMYGLWMFPELNIEGVAIATLVSRIVNLTVTLIVLNWGMKLMSFRFPSHKRLRSSAGGILKIAVPAGAGNVTNPIGIGIITAALANFGDNTVAAFGVGTRIEAFVCLPMLALS